MDQSSVQSAPLTRAQRASDAVTEFCGSWGFILSFSAITIGWMALNTVLILTKVFDPYPFILLNLFLTVVSTFQSPLIMMSQNRQVERDREAVRGLHAKLDALGAQSEVLEALRFARAYIGKTSTRVITDRIDAAISKAEGTAVQR